MGARPTPARQVLQVVTVRVHVAAAKPGAVWAPMAAALQAALSQTRLAVPVAAVPQNYGGAGALLYGEVAATVVVHAFRLKRVEAQVVVIPAEVEAPATRFIWI